MKIVHVTGWLFKPLLEANIQSQRKMKLTLCALALSLCSVASGALVQTNMNPMDMKLVETTTNDDVIQTLGPNTHTWSVGKKDGPDFLQVSLGDHGIVLGAKSEEGDSESKTLFIHETSKTIPKDMIEKFPEVMAQVGNVVSQMLNNKEMIEDIKPHPQVEELE